MTLGGDTKAVILAAGAMFLLALLLGVWKYRQMATSDDHLAHPYVDVAQPTARRSCTASPRCWWRPSCSSAGGVSLLT